MTDRKPTGGGINAGLIQALFEQLQSRGVEIGVDRATVIGAISEIADMLRSEAVAEGNARAEPWGLGINPHTLRGWIRVGLAEMESASASVSERPESAMQQEINGVFTVAAAALLHLEGSPYPVELIRRYPQLVQAYFREKHSRGAS